jgi:starvation-inducible outer membrane lipoprotein
MADEVTDGNVSRPIAPARPSYTWRRGGRVSADAAGFHEPRPP